MIITVSCGVFLVEKLKAVSRFHGSLEMSIFPFCVLVVQTPNLTLWVSSGQPLHLVSALSDDGSASGDLFWDDGESIDTYETSQYAYVVFSVAKVLCKRVGITSVYLAECVSTPMCVIVHAAGLFTQNMSLSGSFKEPGAALVQIDGGCNGVMLSDSPGSSQNVMTSEVLHNHLEATYITVDSVRVCGVKQKPSLVLVNSQGVPFTYRENQVSGEMARREKS